MPIHGQDQLVFERLRSHQREIERHHQLSHTHKPRHVIQHLIRSLGDFFVRLGIRMKQFE